MLIGYARVSTADQALDLQKDALRKAGCKLIFENTSSGAKSDRPGLNEALAYLRAGDTLVFWKLDRVIRSLQRLITLAQECKARGIGLKSLQDQIDTSSRMDRFLYHAMSTVAKLERDLTSGHRSHRSRHRECAASLPRQ